MQRYVTNPHTVEAVQVREDNRAELMNLVEAGELRDTKLAPGLIVPMGRHQRYAAPGDWIIRDRHGKLSVLPDEDFQDTHQPVNHLTPTRS